METFSLDKINIQITMKHVFDIHPFMVIRHKVCKGIRS